MAPNYDRQYRLTKVIVRPILNPGHASWEFRIVPYPKDGANDSGGTWLSEYHLTLPKSAWSRNFFMYDAVMIAAGLLAKLPQIDLNLDDKP